MTAPSLPPAADRPQTEPHPPTDQPVRSTSSPYASPKGDSSATPYLETRAHGRTSIGGLSPRYVLVNIIIPLLILSVGGGVLAALGTVEPESREPDDQTIAGRMRRLPPVEVTRTISLQEVGKPLELRVDGVVVPYREFQIAAEVSGRIVEKSPNCRAGNFVTQGDLLCRIDPTDYEQEVMRLSQAREQDYEALKEVDQEISNAKLTLDIARQDIELAQREVARLKSLPRGFVSDGEIDQAEKSLLASTQTRVGIENQMNLLAARRSRLEASERLATTQLETAKINLKRCEVRSPADGVIVREDAEVNSFIQRGSSIITLEDISKVEVAINLRMDQLYWVLDQNQDSGLSPIGQVDLSEIGSRRGYSLPATPAIVEYELSGMAGQTYRWNGTLVRYDGIGMDSRTRTVPVKVEVDAPNRRITSDGQVVESSSPSALVRGMFVSVRLLIEPQTPLVAMPSIAMRPGNRVWQFVPDPGVLAESSATESDGGTDGESSSPSDDESSELSDDGSSVAANRDATAEALQGSGLSAKAAASTSDFDVSQWVAGRVVIRGNLTPVDSLWLSEIEPRETRDRPMTADTSRRYWVCAVPDGEIQGGDWLVVSPLGDFGGGGDDGMMSVRVRQAGME